MQLRTTTYNVRFGNNPEKVGADIWRLTRTSDVIVVQEGWPDQFESVWDNLPRGWRAIHRPGTGADELVILYNTEAVKLLGVDARKLLDRVNSPVPGIAKDRHALAATFLPRGSEKPVTVIGTHMPLKGGARLDLALTRLGAFAREFGGRVIIGADWNVNLRIGTPAHRILSRDGLRSGYGGKLMPKRGVSTIGRSLFDGFFSDLDALATEVGRRLSSDHRPVTTTYRV